MKILILKRYLTTNNASDNYKPNRMKMSLVLLFIISFALQGCPWNDDMPSHLKIINRSNSNIYFGVSSSYPDTGLTHMDVIPFYNGNETQKIEAGNSRFIRTIILAEDNTTQMFFFDADLIETEPWDSIVDHYKVLKRYEFTVDNLERMDWLITYP